MCTRIIAALSIVLGAIFSTGCATATHEVITITKTIDKDGKVTEEKKTETKKSAGVVSAGYTGYYNPYYGGGYVGPQATYNPRNRTLEFQESGVQPVMVKKYGPTGLVQMYEVCPNGGHRPIAGKC